MRPDCLVAAVVDDALTASGPATSSISAFYLNSEFDTDAIVRPDGKIELASFGEVTAAGLTPAQLEDHLNRLYSKELLNPGATVRLDEIAGPRGFRRRPGRSSGTGDRWRRA